MHFDTTSGQRSRSEIGEALSESGSILSTSVAFLIRAAAALLPVGVVALVMAWIVRVLIRRRRRKA
jgi:flagellar biosynthesis/type III secretory pathway M-ring protein FliF/YscJ